MIVPFPISGRKIKGLPPPTVSDRTGPFWQPRHPLAPKDRGNSQLAVAEDRSTDTPGPMVDETETFFR